MHVTATVVSQSTGKPIPFNIRLIRKGDEYRLGDSLPHDKDDSLVEFYDARHPHTPLGQFVSRYYLSTILDHIDDGGGRGLVLDGGVRDWVLDSAAMLTVAVVLSNWRALPGWQR